MRIEYNFIVETIKNPGFQEKYPDVEYSSNDISWGDRYYNENGIEYKIKFFDRLYEFGYVYVCEDRDDWAQAESYRQEWIRCNGKRCNWKQLSDEILNYKSNRRDSLLKNILD